MAVGDIFVSFAYHGFFKLLSFSYAAATGLFASRCFFKRSDPMCIIIAMPRVMDITTVKRIGCSVRGMMLSISPTRNTLSGRASPRSAAEMHTTPARQFVYGLHMKTRFKNDAAVTAIVAIALIDSISNEPNFSTI